jgi:hypothetical protein
MRYLTLALALFPFVAFANPGVTKNTDVSKRKAKKHYQLTRCVDDKCEVYEVTEFDKSLKTQGTYSEQCFFIVEDKKRFMACNKMPKPTVVVVEKVRPVLVVKERKVYIPQVRTIQNKKNRFSLHIGYGPNGLTRDSTNNQTGVSEYRSPIVGASYSRLVSNQVSFGLTAFSNSTLALSVGFDF